MTVIACLLIVVFPVTMVYLAFRAPDDERTSYAYITYTLKGVERVAYVGNRERVARILLQDENAFLLPGNRIVRGAR